MNSLGFKTESGKCTKFKSGSNKTKEKGLNDTNEADSAEMEKRLNEMSDVSIPHSPSFDINQIKNQFKLDKYTKMLLRNHTPWYDKVKKLLMI